MSTVCQNVALDAHRAERVEKSDGFDHERCVLVDIVAQLADEQPEKCARTYQAVIQIERLQSGDQLAAVGCRIARIVS